ncbi:hypothetical protein CR513_08683, partial [Mucuna pruriens]
MSPYRIVFGKACHLLVEIKHRAYWELEELRLEAYENSQIYKEKVKHFHDSRILRKEFSVGQKVLLFNSKLKLIIGKLRSKWDRSFVETNIFPYGVVKVRDEANNNTSKVNGNQLKHEGSNLNSTMGEDSKRKDINITLIRSDHGVNLKMKSFNYFVKIIGHGVNLRTPQQKWTYSKKESIKGTFLGYSKTSKEYRVYNSRTLTIKESINVNFKPNKELLELDASFPENVDEALLDDGWVKAIKEKLDQFQKNEV